MTHVRCFTNYRCRPVLGHQIVMAGALIILIAMKKRLAKQVV
jgi:hypothetical protein